MEFFFNSSHRTRSDFIFFFLGKLTYRYNFFSELNGIKIFY